MKPPTIPTRLAERIAAGGPPRKVAKRAAEAGACRGCGVVVLVGLDDEPMGVRADVDPLPLHRRGEALALVNGRATYHLAGFAFYIITRRVAFDIEVAPADMCVVFASHECGNPVPAEWRK